MFAKLLKHEWKATWGILGMLSLCALGAGAVGALMLWILIETADQSISSPLEVISPTLLLFVLLGLVVYSVGGKILLYHRFYKNKFTDEGYLTFTLPARSWQIFLSSFVSILVWSLIIGLVMSVSLGLIVGFGMWEYLKDVISLEVLEEMMEMVNGEVILSLVMGVVDYVSGIVLVMVSITLGAVAAKKHKLLAAVGIYYGASMVRNTMSTAAMAIAMSNMEELENFMTVSNVCNGVLGILFGVGGYFLAVYLMDHKLNLP